jgi:hypothetical protein
MLECGLCKIEIQVLKILQIAETHQIRMPDKLAAIAQLAKLCGWNEPEKFEHGATDTLTEFLHELRSGQRTTESQ